jgi:hypothetical protein
VIEVLVEEQIVESCDVVLAVPTDAMGVRFSPKERTCIGAGTDVR